MISKPLRKDDKAIVLDFLTHGHYDMQRAQPIAQVLGEQYFSLLEVIVREDVTLKVGESVYIGDQKREKIKYIRGRIELRDLTNAAKQELESATKTVIETAPEQYIEFFNKSGNVSLRMHQLELLPGIGKKHLWIILDERKKKPFESFEDIHKRLPMLGNPMKLIVRRVLDEIEDKDKYRLFVPRFDKKREHMERRF
ncbi:MAG: DUF655 domain-containing protein [Nanoarchaeota archaeon]|nr:DUF655 domain-containing protein [Nanoarchaeota archaeon]